VSKMKSFCAVLVPSRSLTSPPPLNHQRYHCLFTPFSPDLIPIEFAFATYKGGIKKFNNKTIAAKENIDCKDYMAIHLKAAALVTPGMMANYFRHLITWDDELLSNHPNSAAYQQQLLIAAVVTVVLDAL